MDKMKDKSLEQFQKAAIRLVAHKLFWDYKYESEDISIEPERFVEVWIRENMFRPTRQIKSNIWKLFLNELSLYSGDK